MSTRYPSIRTEKSDEERFRGHPFIDVRWAEASEPIRCCADSWCDGRCGFPSLVIPAGYAAPYAPELKARSHYVACGDLMQPFRVAWEGSRIVVPEEYRDDLARRVYF